MNILPKPQKLDIKEGFLRTKELEICNLCKDARIENALDGFLRSNGGAQLKISCKDADSEGYTLTVSVDSIEITGDSPRGAFYGIQTLKQLFEEDTVPCLYIEDKPDMGYRGYYHDITRGKVATVDTLKKLIDTLAYYKMNSLQLYVEHTFPFKELGGLPFETGCITADEIRLLDDYCEERFIEFIPSIATFGHLYELLQLEEYKELQTLDNYNSDAIFWRERMNHHTIDPTNPKSIGVITSMIDQYASLFRTDKFNICCDETFDLTNGRLKDLDTGKLYVEFVGKIIAHLKAQGKKVMMWGDILLQHPETVKELPEDTVFLNWDYDINPKEDSFKTFESLGCTQYVCPGTNSWSRFCESIHIERGNIIKTLDYGYKHGATGMLNTNWGDYANPCTLELAMYGTVLGAAKAWNKATMANDEFDAAICSLMYKNQEAVKYLERIDEGHTIKSEWTWNLLVEAYSDLVAEDKINPELPSMDDVKASIEKNLAVVDELRQQSWQRDVFREEMIIAAEGALMMGQLFAKLLGDKTIKVIDICQWLERFKASWLKANKPSELDKIVKMLEYLDRM